jgi:hypothetical protein
MRRPLNWLVLALSVGFYLLNRAWQAPPPPAIVIERARLEPRTAVAVPAALRRHGELEFGYVEQDR